MWDRCASSTRTRICEESLCTGTPVAGGGVAGDLLLDIGSRNLSFGRLRGLGLSVLIRGAAIAAEANLVAAAAVLLDHREDHTRLALTHQRLDLRSRVGGHDVVAAES